MTAAVTNQQEAGWFFLDDACKRRPFAYLSPVDDPGASLMIECGTWWAAMAVALELCRDTEGCTFVGGPGQ